MGTPLKTTFTDILTSVWNGMKRIPMFRGISSQYASPKAVVIRLFASVAFFLVGFSLNSISATIVGTEYKVQLNNYN